MKSKLSIALISIIGAVCLYGLGLFIIKGHLLTGHKLALLASGLIFVSSTLIIASGKELTAEARVQRFMLGTTVQMLVALFFVLIAKFKLGKYFADMALHFLILFGILLSIQATVLVIFTQRK